MQASSEQTSDIIHSQKAQITQNRNTQHLDHQSMTRPRLLHLIHPIPVNSSAISFLYDHPFTLNQIIGEGQDKSSGRTKRIEPQQGRHPNRNRYRRPGKITQPHFLRDRTPASRGPFIEIFELLYEEYAMNKALNHRIFRVMKFIHASENVTEGRKRGLFGIFSKYSHNRANLRSLITLKLML